MFDLTCSIVNYSKEEEETGRSDSIVKLHEKRMSIKMVFWTNSPEFEVFLAAATLNGLKSDLKLRTVVSWWDIDYIFQNFENFNLKHVSLHTFNVGKWDFRAHQTPTASNVFFLLALKTWIINEVWMFKASHFQKT